MKAQFNIMSIIFMMIAIGLGTLFGSPLAGIFGFTGGIIGAILVGLVIYAIWAVLSGQKLNMWQGIMFAILVWLANIISGVIQGATGFGGGIIGLAVTALIVSFLWGYFGSGGSASLIATGKQKKPHR